MENPQASLAHQFEELKRLQEATKKERDDALKQIEELHRTKGGVINYTEFSRAELEVATKNFDESLVIGKGGFATVYKGFLRHTTVAIKILNPEKYQGNIKEEFNLEVEILTKVRHPNLVLLIGSSMEAWALIYEFLPNSLDAYLNNEPGRRKLSWQNRIRIASEICSALIFLHSVGKNGIAHGDLKPQNILLDSSFVSKIIDFGISRELNKSDETLTPFHVTKIPKYTPAYADPEFFSTGELTPHCDVYSYGIILLQFVTGRGPHKIRYYVEDILENDKLDKLVDRSAGNWPIEEAKKLAFLGLSCIDQSRKKRPELASEVWVKIESMKDIAYKLQVVEIEDNTRATIAMRKAYNKSCLKGKRKEYSPQDAAMLIQLNYRAHLARRSQVLRCLREMAVAKAKLKEIRSLFYNFSYRRRVACDSAERQRFSEKMIVLLLTVDAVEGPDYMGRAAKKSMVEELEAMLEVVDPRPSDKLSFVRRCRFDLPEGPISPEMHSEVLRIVEEVEEEAK